MTIDPGWPVAAALLSLVALALAANVSFGHGLARESLVAVVRAILQLGLAALIITNVVKNLALSLVTLAFMFTMAVLTTTRRIGARRCWPWAALAMASGLVPVIAIILATRTVPLTGIALIPVVGIVLGNTMNVHTLVGRRCFAALRDEHGQYEAGLSLGLSPAAAIREIIHRRVPEGLVPGLDQVRTAGVVTLPGAFIGVMLGGGSAAQAATAQVLVLVAIMATQNVTAGVQERLIAARRIVPDDLRARLID